MTAAPESEAEDSGKAGLLRDIGRSNSLKTGAGNAESDLMRAAHDPLLVRRLVLKKEMPHGGPEMAAEFSRAIPPAIPFPVTGEGIGTLPSGAVPVASRYEAPAGRLEPSLSPTAFAPAPEDREAALDIGFTHRSAASDMGFARRLFWLGLGSAMVIGFILLPG